MDNALPNQQIEQPQVTNNQELLNVSTSEGKKGSLYGIVFVIIILVFLLGTLNYFNILSISDVFPNQLSWLPRKEVSSGTSQNISLQKQSSVLLPTPTFLSNPLVAKAKAIGYNIIWIDPNDTTGRTVFYEEREKSDFNFRGIGIIYTRQSASPSSELISYISGIVNGFEDINNSEDEYLLLTDPQTKLQLPKTRIIFNKNSSTSTSFLVENLSYGENNQYDFKKDLTNNIPITLSNLGKDDFKKIVRNGDAVILTVLSKAKSGELVNTTDENKQLIATLLVVRRFGGQSQVEKELRKTL